MAPLAAVFAICAAHACAPVHAQTAEQNVAGQYAVVQSMAATATPIATVTAAADLPLTATAGNLQAVQVIDSLQAQRQFDSAASQTSVVVDGFADNTPLVNLSELLAGQAGVVAQDRGN